MGRGLTQRGTIRHPSADSLIRVLVAVILWLGMRLIYDNGGPLSRIRSHRNPNRDVVAVCVAKVEEPPAVNKPAAHTFGSHTVELVGFGSKHLHGADICLR